MQNINLSFKKKKKWKEKRLFASQRVLLQVWRMLKNACRVRFSGAFEFLVSPPPHVSMFLEVTCHLTTVTSSKTKLRSFPSGADGVKCCSGPHADQTGASSQYLVCNRSLNSDLCYLWISGFSCILHFLKMWFCVLLTFIMLLSKRQLIFRVYRVKGHFIFTSKDLMALTLSNENKTWTESNLNRNWWILQHRFESKLNWL